MKPSNYSMALAAAIRCRNRSLGKSPFDGIGAAGAQTQGRERVTAIRQNL